MAALPDSLVDIQPTDLKFRFALNKQLLATITINNKSDQRVAFKIKTTAPKKYVVRPSSGVVEPRTSQAVQVIMQAQKDYPPDFQTSFKDKFMVQTTALGPEEQLDKDTFVKESRKDLREARLKVVMEGPPAPPSPVPEANEADGEGTDSASRGLPAAGAVLTSDTARLRTDPTGAETTALRAQLEALTKERDDLRRKMDYIELQGGAGALSAQKAASKPAVDPALKFRITMIHIILVAIIGFLVGHFT